MVRMLKKELYDKLVEKGLICKDMPRDLECWDDASAGYDYIRVDFYCPLLEGTELEGYTLSICISDDLYDDWSCLEW